MIAHVYNELSAAFGDTGTQHSSSGLIELFSPLCHFFPFFSFCLLLFFDILPTPDGIQCYQRMQMCEFNLTDRNTAYSCCFIFNYPTSRRWKVYVKPPFSCCRLYICCHLPTENTLQQIMKAKGFWLHSHTYCSCILLLAYTDLEGPDGMGACYCLWQHKGKK